LRKIDLGFFFVFFLFLIFFVDNLCCRAVAVCGCREYRPCEMSKKQELRRLSKQLSTAEVTGGLSPDNAAKSAFVSGNHLLRFSSILRFFFFFSFFFFFFFSLLSCVGSFHPFFDRVWLHTTCAAKFGCEWRVF
jgi:hypothetical protein